MVKWRHYISLCILAALGLVCVGLILWVSPHADRQLAVRLALVAPPAARAAHDCRGGSRQPLVLLVLGQSNAGNHGAEADGAAAGEPPEVTVFTGRACQRAVDPLPGGTGRHRSIWPRLEAQLAQLGVQREVIVALLAVDASSIDDWTRVGSPLRQQLQELLAALHAAKVSPDFVLWQQGEADARAGTSETAYGARLQQLRGQLRTAGVWAPMLLARSTRCRNNGGSAIRAAIEAQTSRHVDLVLGPDTDMLSGQLRDRDCHFSRQGLEAAAELWAKALLPLLR